MRPPKLSIPITLLIMSSSVAGTIILQWMILHSYFNLKHNYEFWDVSFFLIAPNLLLWWLTFAAFRRYHLRPLSINAFFSGIAGIIFIGMAGVVFERVFTQAQGKAPMASCMSNLKQISLSVIMYSQDYDETLPLAPQWAAQTAVYVKKPAADEVWHCPTATSPYSYAMNRDLSSISLSRINEPYNVITLFESDAVIWNMSGGQESLPKPGRHSDGGIYALLDGHAKYLSDSTVHAPNGYIWHLPQTPTAQH